MYGMALEYVKDEPRSTFMFTRGLSYIASISFTRVIIIEAMYGGSCVNEEVEPRATFTFTRGVNFTCVQTGKLRDSGKQPLANFQPND